jgi:hypothetical protein
LLPDLAYSKSLEKAAKKTINTAQLSAQERRKRTLLKDSRSFVHVHHHQQKITLTPLGEHLKDKKRMLDFGMF